MYLYIVRWNASSVAQADVAKLETSISLSGYRIELKMFGFSEKLPALARKIASHMKTLISTELDFEVGTRVGTLVQFFGSLELECSLLWCWCRSHEGDGRNLLLMQRTVEVLSEEYIRANEKPIEHAAYLSKQALSKRFWSVDLRRDCLQNLTFQDFTKFVANLFSKVSSTYHRVSFHLSRSPLLLYMLCFRLGI